MRTTKQKQAIGQVYSYARWSSEPQSAGDTERRQEQMALDWCKRNGRTLSQRRFTDRGVSGWKGANRQCGALGALLKILEPNDTVLVENIDRLSREKPLQSMNALEAIANRGIQIVLLETGVTVTASNFNDAAVLFPVFFGSYLANAENEKKAFRIRESMQARRAQVEAGKAVRGRLPAWLTWSREEDKPVVIEDKAKVVRRVFELCNEGHGVMHIEKAMRNVPPIANSRKANWNSRFIHRLLTDKSVLGFHGPTDRAGVYPAILDEKQFYMAGMKLKERKNQTVRTAYKNNNLFTGLLRCSKCGNTLTRQVTHSHGKVYTYLICSGNLRGRSDCNCHGVRYETFENQVLTSMTCKADVMKALTGETPKASPVETLKARLSEAQGQADKYFKLIDTDPNPSPRLVAKFKDLEAQVAKLQSEIEVETAKERASVTAPQAYEQFLTAMPIQDRSEFRQRLRGVIERIDVVLGKGNFTIRFKGGAEMLVESDLSN